MFELKPEYQKLLEISGFCAFIAIIVLVFKTVITKNYGTWNSFFVELASSLFVAIMVGFLIHETEFSIITKSGIIGFCVFISKDILEVINKFRIAFVTDPRGFIKEVLDTWKGR